MQLTERALPAARLAGSRVGPILAANTLFRSAPGEIRWARAAIDAQISYSERSVVREAARVPWLQIGIAAWLLCAALGAALLSRLDRAGTGALLGALLGPLGIVVVLVARPRWAARDRRDALEAESRREEQAWREWKGY